MGPFCHYRQRYIRSLRRIHASRFGEHPWAPAEAKVSAHPRFVLFLANTGLRPDEAKNLQHRDVAIVKDDATGETILEIEVRGKAANAESAIARACQAP